MFSIDSLGKEIIMNEKDYSTDTIIGVRFFGGSGSSRHDCAYARIDGHWEGFQGGEDEFISLDEWRKSILEWVNGNSDGTVFDETYELDGATVYGPRMVRHSVPHPVPEQKQFNDWYVPHEAWSGFHYHGSRQFVCFLIRGRVDVGVIPGLDHVEVPGGVFTRRKDGTWKYQSEFARRVLAGEVSRIHHELQWWRPESEGQACYRLTHDDVAINAADFLTPDSVLRDGLHACYC